MRTKVFARWTVGVAMMAAFPLVSLAQAHAEVLTRPDPIQHQTFSTSGMLALTYTPSPDDDAFDNGVGGELSVLLNEGGAAGLKLSIGVERWQAADRGPADLQLIPLGIGVHVGGAFSPGVLGYAEFGVKYSLVDADTESYEDAITGFVGAGLAFETFGTGGVDVAVGYQFDIQEPDNDAGDELSLQGLFLRVGLRAFP